MRTLPLDNWRWAAWSGGHSTSCFASMQKNAPEKNSVRQQIHPTTLELHKSVVILYWCSVWETNFLGLLTHLSYRSAPICIYHSLTNKHLTGLCTPGQICNGEDMVAEVFKLSLESWITCNPTYSATCQLCAAFTQFIHTMKPVGKQDDDQITMLYNMTFWATIHDTSVAMHEKCAHFSWILHLDMWTPLLRQKPHLHNNRLLSIILAIHHFLTHNDMNYTDSGFISEGWSQTKSGFISKTQDLQSRVKLWDWVLKFNIIFSYPTQRSWKLIYPFVYNLPICILYEIALVPQNNHVASSSRTMFKKRCVPKTSQLDSISSTNLRSSFVPIILQYSNFYINKKILNKTVHLVMSIPS